MELEEILEIREQVINLLEEKKYSQTKQLLEQLNPADIALLFDDIERKDVPILFKLLNKDNAAITFSYMDTEKQQELIALFNDKELREIINEMYIDDTVDIIEELPANVVDRILRNIDPQTRKTINELLHYPDDSAGSMMTTEYVNLKKDMTVEQAFAHIRRDGINKETIYTCYVTSDRKLIGLVTVKDLLLAKYEDVIEDIMETNVIYVDTHEDQEIVAQMFNKYDFLALPVVDGEERLVGIVTVDDAMEVMQEEIEEDIEAMNAMLPSDKPYIKTGVFEIWKNRIPWLLLLMLSATFTGKIIQGFENALESCVILTAFIPMLMGTGGNAGGQASVTVIRSLSMNEIDFKDTFRVLWKEFRVSLLCALTLGIISFGKCIFLDGASPIESLVVSITLVLAVIVAKLIGALLPIIIKKIGLDPAVVVSPFITTIIDAVALLIYFNIAALILPGL